MGTIIFQNHIILTKDNWKMQWHVTYPAKVFLCKKAGGRYPCDYHGINLHVEIYRSRDNKLIFEGAIATNFKQTYDYDIDVIISVDPEIVGPDGAAMYVHLEDKTG
ncbi:hypothetical protein [Bacillus sp. GM_Baccil_2]|uniref:hypothetical protein n=1 Tax=Bacillus sp. GM_Baccil_2 TaxID=2937369 RepID=UPI00226A1154